VSRPRSFKLFPHHEQALKSIERWADARPVYYVPVRNPDAPEPALVIPIGAEQWRALQMLTPPPPRFNTSRLASKLARALHDKTP